MVIVYGVPQSQKTRKTKTLLEENGIEYEFINVKNSR